jgi:hypothetical protein
MKLASRVFRIAGIYGLIGLVPQYFTEEMIGRDYPPAITHPEFFYGFLGVAITWQIVFLLISKDPLRYRILMLPSILEKIGFGLPALLLFFGHRTSTPTLVFGVIDLILGAAFVLAYIRTSAGEMASRVVS